MKIEPHEKVTVLLAALGERYSSLRAIRSRVESTGVWVIGLSLAGGGWLLQSNVSLSCEQRALLITGALLALGALRFLYLADLQRGFAGQQRVAARIEGALGHYTVGEFDAESEPICPASWRKAGSKGSDGKFFRSTYVLLYLAAAFLTIAILASGTLSVTP